MNRLGWLPGFLLVLPWTLYVIVQAVLTPEADDD